ALESSTNAAPCCYCWKFKMRSPWVTRWNVNTWRTRVCHGNGSPVEKCLARRARATRAPAAVPRWQGDAPRRSPVDARWRTLRLTGRGGRSLGVRQRGKRKGTSLPPGKGRDVPLHALYAHHNSTALCAAQHKLALTGWL